MRKRVIKAKQFAFPIDEDAYEHIINKEGIEILEEKIFQTKIGDVVVFIKWEQFADTQIGGKDDEFFE